MNGLFSNKKSDLVLVSLRHNFLASYLSKHFGHLWLFWLLGGCLLGLTAQLCFVEKPKRTPTRLIVSIIIGGLAASLAVLIMGTLSL